jgi:hypothetical protein
MMSSPLLPARARVTGVASRRPCPIVANEPTLTNNLRVHTWRTLKVDMSELPFRMLCRKYGAELCYTPMYHSRMFAEEPKYRYAHARRGHTPTTA